MSNMITKPKKPNGAPRKFDRELVGNHVCSELMKGRSLNNILVSDSGMPSPASFLEWVNQDPEGLGKQYAHAREIGYKLLAEEIVAISDENYTLIECDALDSDGNPMLDQNGNRIRKSIMMPLSSDAIARNRLRVDTRKWMLSKVLPKIYGDKLTTEHTGKDGGPITLAAIDLTNLSDDELVQMQKLLGKAGGPNEQ